MKAPPLLVSFQSFEDFLQAFENSIDNIDEKQLRKLYEQKLPPIESKLTLAIMFGFSPKFIGALYENTNKYYRHFTIQKGKKRRLIQAPKVALKVIQKWIAHHLSCQVFLPDNVYGFVKGRSSIDAAQQHCEAKWVYSIDLEDFFPSTPKNLIIASLQELGYTPKAADLIAQLCSYNDKLAQGSPASPVLSNLIFKNIDLQLIELASSYGITYTRYADDIVFSGKDHFNDMLKKDVKTIIDNTCWKISKKKESLTIQPKRVKVHGLLVHNKHPRLTKGYRNRLRAYKHLLDHGKITENQDKIMGHLAFQKAVDKKDN